MIKKFKKINKKYIIIGGIVLLVFILFIIGSDRGENYLSYEVARADVSDKLLLAGTIEARQRVDLGFGISGRVTTNNFVTGDTVRKGQVIAEVAQNRLQSDLIQAQAQYTLTRVDGQSDVVGAESSYETQKKEQDALVTGAYRQYLGGDVQAYVVGEKDADKTSPKISGSYTGNKEGSYFIEMYRSSSESGYSFRLSGLESGTYTAYTNQLGPLGEQGLFIQFDSNTIYTNTIWEVPLPNIRSESYLARKTAYENALATRERVLTLAQNSLDRLVAEESGLTRREAEENRARAQVQAVYAQLGDGRIIAPFDGVIAKNNIAIGDMVNAFTSQVVFFADNQKKLTLNVPEIYINKVSEGDTVIITLDAYTDLTFEGVVEHIDMVDTRVDGVPVYQTEVILEDDDERIRVGMNAKANIIVKEQKEVLAIPAHYLQTTSSGVNTVLVRDDTQIIEKEVQIGIYGNDGLVEIISGLMEGETIYLLKR